MRDRSNAPVLCEDVHAPCEEQLARRRDNALRKCLVSHRNTSNVSAGSDLRPLPDLERTRVDENSISEKKYHEHEAQGGVPVANTGTA